MAKSHITDVSIALFNLGLFYKERAMFHQYIASCNHATADFLVKKHLRNGLGTVGRQNSVAQQ